MLETIGKELRDASEVDEYIVSERHTKGVRREIVGSGLSQRLEGREVEAQIFVDRELGRGHSRFVVPPDAALQPLIQESASRAASAMGPSWRLRPPSAPALVRLSDKEWADNLAASADAIEQQFRAHLPRQLRVLEASIEVMYQDTHVLLSNGFDNQFRGTHALIHMLLEAEGGRPVRASVRARRKDDLPWSPLFEDAERRSQQKQGEASLAGACDVLLLSSAYTPQGQDDFGLWTPLVRQSSARLGARGLARYQEGQEILPAPAKGDSLTLRSDGTLDFGLRSAPFDNEGQAVRRFPLVEAGRATGRSLNFRDAALLGIEANGGVRNLVVDSGKSSMAELSDPGERPLLLVRRASELHSESRGQLCLRIDSGQWIERDQAGGIHTKDVHSGLLCGNLYDWLQNARFSRERADLLWYQGPKAIRFQDRWLHS